MQFAILTSVTDSLLNCVALPTSCIAALRWKAGVKNIKYHLKRCVNHYTLIFKEIRYDTQKVDYRAHVPRAREQFASRSRSIRIVYRFVRNESYPEY